MRVIPESHKERKPESSAPHFTKYEVLLNYQGHLRVKCYLFYGIRSIRLLEFICQFLVRECVKCQGTKSCRKWSLFSLFYNKLLRNQVLGKTLVWNINCKWKLTMLFLYAVLPLFLYFPVSFVYSYMLWQITFSIINWKCNCFIFVETTDFFNQKMCEIFVKCTIGLTFSQINNFHKIDAQIKLTKNLQKQNYCWLKMFGEVVIWRWWGLF